MSLFKELKRRKVFKVGAAYLVVAWLAVQVVSIAFPAFEAPPWVLRVFILIAMLGFPVTLMMAWAFEATPEGLRRDSASAGGKRMAAIFIVLIGLALAWYFLGTPAMRADEPLGVGPEVASVPAPAPASAPTANVAPRLSIAVLPFVNMSADKDNEYFSDGISEEILNALAKVDGLKVAGRTSSFTRYPSSPPSCATSTCPSCGTSMARRTCAERTRGATTAVNEAPGCRTGRTKGDGGS